MLGAEGIKIFVLFIFIICDYFVFCAQLVRPSFHSIIASSARWTSAPHSIWFLSWRVSCHSHFYSWIPLVVEGEGLDSECGWIIVILVFVKHKVIACVVVWHSLMQMLESFDTWRDATVEGTWAKRKRKRTKQLFCERSGDRNGYKISGYEEDYRPERPMVQRQLSEAPSASGGHRETSRMGLGIGYTAYQSGYNKLFTQVCLYTYHTLSLSLKRKWIEYWTKLKMKLTAKIVRESAKSTSYAFELRVCGVFIWNEWTCWIELHMRNVFGIT